MTDEQPTWEPLAEPYDRNDNGKLDRREQRELPGTAFAFPRARALPLVDADHVRAAVEQLRGVTGVSDDERRAALDNIRLAGAHFGVPLADDE